MGLTDEQRGLMDLPTPNYTYIKSTEEALRVLPELERQDILEVDTEDTALDPWVAKTVLLQIGILGKAYVFDVRKGNVDGTIFKSILEGNKQLKLLQNANYDYKVLKTNFGIELNRIYDTMLAEQLLYLGEHPRAALQYLVGKYLGMRMPKDVANSFVDYNQEYQEYQLRYAANDVTVLREIYNIQLEKLRKDDLMRVARLEFDFVKPLSEMELNGVLLDIPQWRGILDEMLVERNRLRIQLDDIFNGISDQTTLFGVSTMNLDSPLQLVAALNKLGIAVESTDIKELGKYKDHSVIKTLLEYRKYEKFITTYGEPMIGRIHPVTGRLHTNFKQMVDTGRLSSSDPNMQNIPKEQKYRSCFIARPGYKLITADMSQAELRILADYSRDPSFLDAYAKGQDLHIRTASDVFGVPIEEIMQDEKYKKSDLSKYRGYRNKTKSINFGLCYGLTKVGLALRLEISEKEAQSLIDKYFEKYVKIKEYLDRSGNEAVRSGYSKTISGRRRYYALPSPTDPTFKKVRGSIERQGKNHPIQGSNADTVKQAMVYVVERIKPYDARLLLTVHDEVVVEAREDQVEEVKAVVAKSVCDGFGEFFHTVHMETEALVGDCWLKG